MNKFWSGACLSVLHGLVGADVIGQAKATADQEVAAKELETGKALTDDERSAATRSAMLNAATKVGWAAGGVFINYLINAAMDRLVAKAGQGGS